MATLSMETYITSKGHTVVPCSKIKSEGTHMQKYTYMFAQKLKIKLLLIDKWPSSNASDL